MGKDTKIAHVVVLDGEPEMIKALAENLRKVKENSGLDIEFLVTNDKVQLRDVKYLIDELYKLYKSYKSVAENIGKKNEE